MCYKTDFSKINKAGLCLLWEHIQQLAEEQGLKKETLEDCAKALREAIDKRTNEENQLHSNSSLISQKS